MSIQQNTRILVRGKPSSGQPRGFRASEKFFFSFSTQQLTRNQAITDSQAGFSFFFKEKNMLIFLVFSGWAS